MVTIIKTKPGHSSSRKSDRQQRLEDIRNRQSCSMKAREHMTVTIKKAPWDKPRNA